MLFLRPLTLSALLLPGTLPALAAAAETTKPLEVCLGGFDHGKVSELPQALAEAETGLPVLKKLGATSHESYVRWSMIEPEEGKFDFSYWDKYLDAHKKAGLRWVPFLIVGSAYSLPDWFFKSPRHQGYVCLEHGEQTHIESLWNPELRPLVQRAVREFAKHYSREPQLESLLLGITGNYGESIYPASPADWTADAHGMYHAHYGWWCGDPHAVASFREDARRRHSTLEALNQDWGTTFTRWEDVRPRLPEDWPTTAPRQQQSEWYLGAMTEYADFWMKTAKEQMPNTDVYLVVGGHAPPYHGFDVSAQAKVAAQRGVGLRVTNEDDRYYLNFAITRMIASACRQYGTFFSIEPAGLVTEKGVAGRIFNASASGAKNIHWYFHNFHGAPKTEERWHKLRHFARQRDPVVDVAVFYPRRWMNLRAEPEIGPMYEDLARLRNASDYDFLDERMMEDLAAAGKKPGYKKLLVRGGSVEDEVSSNALQRLASLSPEMEIITVPAGATVAPDAEQFLGDLSRRLHPEDDFTSGVFFSRFTDGSLLFLNQRPTPVNLAETHPRMVKEPVIVEPYGLAEVPRRRE